MTTDQRTHQFKNIISSLCKLNVEVRLLKDSDWEIPKEVTNLSDRVREIVSRVDLAECSVEADGDLRSVLNAISQLGGLSERELAIADLQEAEDSLKRLLRLGRLDASWDHGIIDDPLHGLGFDLSEEFPTPNDPTARTHGDVESEDVKSTPEDVEVLVTCSDIAKSVGLEERSMSTHRAMWCDPVVSHRGRRPAQWKLSAILPVLKQQFPDVDDSCWKALENAVALA